MKRKDRIKEAVMIVFPIILEPTAILWIWASIAYTSPAFLITGIIFHSAVMIGLSFYWYSDKVIHPKIKILKALLSPVLFLILVPMHLCKKLKRQYYQEVSAYYEEIGDFDNKGGGMLSDTDRMNRKEEF